MDRIVAVAVAMAVAWTSAEMVSIAYTVAGAVVAVMVDTVFSTKVTIIIPPAGLASEYCVVECTTSTRVWSRTVQRDVVVSPVPDGTVDHAIGTESHDGTNDSAGDTVIPIMEFVDGEGTSN